MKLRKQFWKKFNAYMENGRFIEAAELVAEQVPFITKIQTSLFRDEGRAVRWYLMRHVWKQALAALQWDVAGVIEKRFPLDLRDDGDPATMVLE